MPDIAETGLSRRISHLRVVTEPSVDIAKTEPGEPIDDPADTGPILLAW